MLLPQIKVSQSACLLVPTCGTKGKGREGKVEIRVVRGKKGHTVLPCNFRPDAPSSFINHNIPHPVPPPLAEQTRDLLSCSHFRNLETHHRDSGLDTQKPGEPILGLRLDDSWGRDVGTCVVFCCSSDRNSARILKERAAHVGGVVGAAGRAYGGDAGGIVEVVALGLLGAGYLGGI